MRSLKVDFDLTFKALEAGLQVQHIAEFELMRCCPGQPVAELLADARLAAFDQFPVDDHGRIVGVLERRECRSAGRAADVMRHLDSSMLVADSQPVGALLDDFGRLRYRLVVQGGDIEGIVTPSDFLKLPVRLYAFMLITHLEMMMGARIRQEFKGGPPDAWLGLLSEGRQQRVRDKLASYSRKRSEPDPIEFTDFCDKREILRKHRQESAPFKRDLEQIEKLRDSLAYAGNFLSEDDDLDHFLHRLRLTRSYIGRFRLERPQDYN